MHPLALFLLVLTVPPLSAADPAGRLLEKSIVLPVPRAEAWHYWTTNEGFRQSVGVQGSDIELKLGGKYEIYFSMTAPAGQRGSEGARVLAYHPLEFLAFTWNAPPKIAELRNAGAMTEMVVRFKEVPGGTEVRIYHLITGSGAAWDGYYAYFDKAWPNVLRAMKEYGGKGDRPTKGVAAPSDLNALSHEAVVDAPVADVWKAFTTREGIESWMVPRASIDLKVMGKMLTTYNNQATLGDESTIENTIRAYLPERLLVMQCTKTPKGFPHPEAFYPVWSVLYFEPVNEKQTRVRSVGLNYGDDEPSRQVRKFFDAGNAFTLRKLQERFAAKR
jgi:uncharacterized protein YndB with AHSA1/START domain